MINQYIIATNMGLEPMSLRRSVLPFILISPSGISPDHYYLI